MVDVERAREFAVRARAQMREGNNRVAIVLLARAFHALEHAAGLDPWDPEALYHWSVENLHTDGEQHCARFVLSLWNQDDFDDFDAEHDNRLGRFDALRSVADWDHAHRAAFAVWTLDPWWP